VFQLALTRLLGPLQSASLFLDVKLSFNPAPMVCNLRASGLSPAGHGAARPE